MVVVTKEEVDEEGAREIGEARTAVGSVLGVAEEVGESEIGEAKTVVGAVVVAVGLERAVVAEEEGAGETGGIEKAVAWRRNWCGRGRGGGCSTKRFVAGWVDGAAWLQKERIA